MAVCRSLLFLCLTVIVSARAASAKENGDVISSSGVLTKTALGQRLAKGSSLLLPVMPRPSVANRSVKSIPTRKPRVKSIRLGVVNGTRCAPNTSALFLWMVAEHMGPTRCATYPRESNPPTEFLRNTIDVYARHVLIHGTDYAFLYTHTKDDICLVIHRSEPQRQSILQSFSLTTWAATCACMVLFGLAQRLAGREGIPLQTLRTCISGGFTEAHSHPISNALALLLSAFGLIMVSAFCGRFTGYLTVGDNAVQPQTLREANALVTKVHGAWNLLVSLDIFDDQDAARPLVMKSPPITAPQLSLPEMMSEVASTPSTAMVIAREEYLLLRRHPLWVDEASGRSLTYLVPECLVSPAYRVFLARRGWPLLEALSTMQRRALEAGLRYKTETDVLFKFRVSGQVIPDVTPSEEPVPLRLMAMLEPIFLLGGGTALAAVAFAGECVAHRRRRRLERPQQQKQKKKQQQKRIGPKWFPFRKARVN